MLEINVAPPQLRKKRKRGASAMGVFKIPKEAIIGLVGGLFVLLILAHLVLQGIIFVKFAQHTSIKKQWEEILPEKKEVDVILNELRMLQNKVGAIEKVTTGKRIFWASKLNDISDSLPRGIWLRKLSLDEKVLIIDGSAYSKLGDEMISVGNFVTNLKDKESFLKGLENIEVGSIQRGKIRNIDIANFIITIKVK